MSDNSIRPSATLLDEPTSERQQGGPRMLVVGCGGIGGIVAAHLLEQRHDVTALTTNPHIADAINESGFRVRGDNGPGTVKGRAVRELDPKSPPFDYIFLATQPPQVEEAARGVVSQLSPSGSMVVLQNGLCEPRIAKIAGENRVIGAVVAWGASMLEPGVYDRTSPGGFVLGRLSGSTDDSIEALGRMLEAIGPTTITPNLPGARWSKLAINCSISSLGAVGGERLGVLMRYRFIRRLALEIMTEVVQVARAEGVRLEKVSGTLDLDWMALSDADRHAAGSPSLFTKHTLLLAVGARFRRMRSSMLAAIERGRPPSVDFLNGEIIEHGAKLGIPTPINAAVRDQVLDIARGKCKSSLDLARALFDRTRALVTREALAEARGAESAGAPRQRSGTVALDPSPEALEKPAASKTLDDRAT
ncbi:MAG: 2-dehydropantoate 2-reductase [Polyangiaceae bacterium]|nr:2-dehydropantoate 2-reductase [Polyangiaceae bacterium]